MVDCSGEYVVWIHDIFGDCVSTTRDWVAFVFGLMVTVIWLYAQLPQIVLNFRNHSAEALSVTYYLFVVGAGIVNVVACFLNETMVTQKIAAIWGVFSDGTTLLQYIYYHWVKPWWTGEPCIDPGANEESDETYIADTLPAIPTTPLLIASATCISSDPDDPYSRQNLVGTLLGWIGGIPPVVARVPQVVKNWKRQRTTGLSLTFWISSVCANACYGISIVTKEPTWEYFWKQLPWFVGSAGCLPFDITILIQFCYYRKKRGHRRDDRKQSTQSDSVSQGQRLLMDSENV